MQSLPEAGSMLSAELWLSAAQALVADEREVAIAAHNGARRVVLSGSSARLQVLQAELTSRWCRHAGWWCRTRSTRR